MKFLMDFEGVEAINTNFVKSIALERITWKEGGEIIRAVAELPDEEEDGIILKEFDSGDPEQDLQDAKEYLAKLIEKLNGGTL